MDILLLAPNPFYQERGTPIAVDCLLRVLSERGDRVDVVTYHEGQNKTYPNVVLHRIPGIPFVRNVKPGFSWKKVVCDLLFGFKLFSLMFRKKFQLVHAVEESVFFAYLIRKFWNIPYIYDMDSHLSRQMIDKKPGLKLFLPLFRLMEGRAIRGAVVVVPVCDALGAAIQKENPRKTVILQDVSLLEEPKDENPEDLKAQFNETGLLVLYVGNLEPYQGIDLLLESFAIVVKKNVAANLAIIGGDGVDIQKYREKSDGLAIGHRVRLVGKRPLDHLAFYLAQADILVSPRTRGENTPMKLYSYLHSGKPILATRLPTHTQILTGEIALLADPIPERFASAMMRLVEDPVLRESLGGRGKHLVEERYSFGEFRKKVFSIFHSIEEDMKSGFIL